MREGIDLHLICTVERSPAKFWGELCVSQHHVCVESGWRLHFEEMAGRHAGKLTKLSSKTDQGEGRQSGIAPLVSTVNVHPSTSYIRSGPQICILDNGHAMPSIEDELPNCCMRPSIMELILRINTSPTRDKDAVKCKPHYRGVCDQVRALAIMGIYVEYAIDTG